MRIRTAALWAGAALAIGLLATTTTAGAAGADVSGARGAFAPNPAFMPNALDAVNPTIGAQGRVHVVVNQGHGRQTRVTLHVEGLPPGRSFGAHLHRDPCSSAFGGPHYQAPDPAIPVAGNADPDHEVWLDFTANTSGRGHAHASVPFKVAGGARSVVIHQGDHTLPGGTAGQRLACLDVEL